MLEEGLALTRALGNDSRVRVALRNLADLYTAVGVFPVGRRRVRGSPRLGTRGCGTTTRLPMPCAGWGTWPERRASTTPAAQYLGESLTLLKPLRDRRCTPLSLEGLACITVGPGWADRAARLLGAAQAMQAQTGAPSPPSIRADYERTVADARQVLGTERFETAWAAGAAMGLDAAVDLALAPPQHEEAAPVPEASRGQPLLPRAPGVPLSPREQEVVTLIAQGLSNRQIPERLTLSVRTVERHIENVYNRLGISGKAGRAIVTAYALRHGLIEPA